MRVTKSGRVRWAGHVAHSKEMRNAYKILAGKHEGNRDFNLPPSCTIVPSQMNVRKHVAE